MKKKQINDVPADVSAKMKTESLRDTLMDLANYAVMTVMRLGQDQKGDE